MVTRLSVNTPSSKLLVVWEVWRLLWVISLVATPTKVLFSETTLFLNSRNSCPRLTPRLLIKPTKNPYPKVFSGCWWLVNYPPKLKLMLLRVNGNTEVPLVKMSSISSYLYPRISTPWPCSPWPSFSSKRTPSSLTFMMKVRSPRRTTGSLSMKIPWTLLLRSPESQPLFTDTSTETLNWSIATPS